MPDRLLGVDIDDPVAFAPDRSILGRVHTGRIGAVLAEYRHVSDLDIGVLAALFFKQVDPKLVEPGLSD